MGLEGKALRMLEGLLATAGKLPQRTLYSLAGVLGALWHRMDSDHRSVALRNLELAYGDELNAADRERICKRVFEHLTRVALELSYMPRLTKENLEKFIEFSGVENLEAAGAKGKGVLIMTSHFGNWELMSLAFSLKYFPVNAVVRPLDIPFLNTLVNRLRSRGGNVLIPKKGSVRQILRLLRNGQIITLLVDQNVDWYDGVFVPFFNEIACTNKALAVLALRTHAPVVPVHNVRMEDGRYAMIFEPEVPIIRTGDTTRDIEENTARLNRIIEGVVRLHPEQWLWVHKRWKTRPYQLWPRQSLKKQRWLVIKPQPR